MTKARDIANLLGANTNGILDNSKITLDAAEIPNLDTGKITTGTFSNGRISAGNVSQHATSFDDNKIVNDISTLALRQSSNENKAAYNSNSMSVDVFQDSTGIASHPTSARNASEYVSSVITGATTTGNDSNTQFLFQPNESNGSTTFTDSSSSPKTITARGGITHSTVQSKFGTSSVFYDVSTNGEGLEVTYASSLGHSSNQPFTLDAWVYSTNWSGANQADMKLWDGASNHRFGFKSNGSSMGGEAFVSGGGWTAHNMSNNAWHHIAWVTNSSNLRRMYVDGVQIFSQTHNDNMNGGQNIMIGQARGLDGAEKCENLYLGGIRRSNVDRTADSNDMMYISGGTSFSVPTGYYGVATLTSNATGNFISNAVTAPSSTTKMGAIITYENTHGTNSLNTDIVLQLSADNGSNFSTATLSAMPDFATGIKMAKVNDLTVTAGTQLKYKVLFANQSAGSKEARIRGVSLQY